MGPKKTECNFTVFLLNYTIPFRKMLSRFYLDLALTTFYGYYLVPGNLRIDLAVSGLSALFVHSFSTPCPLKILLR